MVVYVLGWAVLRFGGPLSDVVVGHLLLTPRRALWPEVWQLVTSAFFLGRLREVLNVAVTLLFFGNTIEQMLGKVGLWKVWLVGAFGGGVMVALLGLYLKPDATFPSGGEGTALLVVYGLMLNQRASLFGAYEMRAGSMAWIWIGIQAVGAIIDIGEGNALAGKLELAEMAGGGIAGWVLARFFLSGASSRSGGGLGDTLDRFKMWRLRRRYKVISGGRGNDDKRYLN